MKTLLLIRHAKSSWDSADLTDFERGLNDRGKHDGPMMAKRIKMKKIQLDSLVSSSAKRARKTAEFFRKEFDMPQNKLVLIPELYEASLGTFRNVVENLDDHYSSVALFAHNPTITDFINTLDCESVYEMPTCAVYAIKIDSKNWKDFQIADKQFLFFDYPKNEDD